VPRGTTGKICQKSPPNTTTKSPKGRNLNHVDMLLRPCTGILKRECAVRPPSSSNAAMPDDATAIATRPCARTVLSKQL
ncbi:hypothetical protein CY35_12G091900, partial [Sphagnum magellanicum]